MGNSKKRILDKSRALHGFLHSQATSLKSFATEIAAIAKMNLVIKLAIKKEPLGSFFSFAAEFKL